VVNNVETLAAVPWIVERGGEAHKSLGFSRSRGTKAVSLNSLFVRPGLYEVEFGIPVRRILEELGGGLKTGPIRGVLIGGPLAGVLPPELFDTPFGFEELRAVGASVGHGGIVAFDGHTSIRDLVDHVFEFGANESCGRCIPCRVGNRRIESLLKEYRLTRGEWNSIVSALASTSLCGLGAGIAEFARSIERHYPRELEACFA
jgi:NADH:ubiquinone oxidoreductase subunit F (NADH-binding)